MANVVRISRGKQILEATEKNAYPTISKAINEAEEMMHRLVPKDSGLLDSTISSEDDGKGHGKIEVGTDYGIHVELGFIYPNRRKVSIRFSSANNSLS